MNKSVITSIQPYWVFLIIAKAMGWDIPQEKTVEIRKSYPKDKAWNKITHIYCSKNRKSFDRIPKQYQPFMKKLLGKVIGEFICDCILSRCESTNADIAEQQGCIKREKLFEYANGKELYGWHISDLKVYNKPKELGEYRPYCEYAERIDGETFECISGRKYGCKFKRFDLNHDGSVNIYTCDKKLTRPPQSWGYVEEL